MEQRTMINSDWHFRKENGAWEDVVIPHTWNGKDGQDGTGMWRGKGIYEKEVSFSEDELKKVLYLEIGAASLVSSVYLNQHHVYTNTCPYSMYRVPINEYIKSGKNMLSVEVDNSYNDKVYPHMADFSFYGGLYRNISIIEAENIHFDYLDGSRDGIYVTAEQVVDKTWNLNVRGKIISEEVEGKVIVCCKLMDKENIICQDKIEIYVMEQSFFSVDMVVLDPHLWDGIEDPYLYQVIIEIKAGGKVFDERKIPFGFRNIQITAEQGCFLNGKHIKIRGVARHQDFGDMGYAITEKEMERDMALLQEMGANSVRLSHYQHDDYFYRLCDENGILVWAEVPFISTPPTCSEAFDNIKEQMERLVKQCYNYCSIYCWGVQNELSATGENEALYDYVREMEQFVKKLDSTRYTAEANIYSVANTSILNQLTDLVGYNLYYGWYYKTIPDLQIRLDEFHKECPNVPLLITEYGVDTNPAYHSYNPSVKDYSEEYQLEFCHNAIRAYEEREFVTGSYVWNMADFGSENRDEGGRKGQNMKGLVTIDRRLKKDAFYLYKAYWAKEPFVKLTGSRFVNRHQEENRIMVLSNLPILQLLVNGRLTDSKENPEPVVYFQVRLFKMGENEIKVKGFDENGKLYEDSMILNRVTESDISYIAEKKDNRAVVTNWFEKFDLSDTTEVIIDENAYSTRDTIGTLLADDRTKVILEKYMEFLLTDSRFIRAKHMTVDALFGLGGLALPKELALVLNRELNQIKKVTCNMLLKPLLIKLFRFC